MLASLNTLFVNLLKTVFTVKQLIRNLIWIRFNCSLNTALFVISIGTGLITFVLCCCVSVQVQPGQCHLCSLQQWIKGVFAADDRLVQRVDGKPRKQQVSSKRHIQPQSKGFTVTSLDLNSPMSIGTFPLCIQWTWTICGHMSPFDPGLIPTWSPLCTATQSGREERRSGNLPGPCIKTLPLLPKRKNSCTLWPAPNSRGCSTGKTDKLFIVQDYFCDLFCRLEFWFFSYLLWCVSGTWHIVWTLRKSVGWTPPLLLPLLPVTVLANRWHGTLSVETGPVCIMSKFISNVRIILPLKVLNYIMIELTFFLLGRELAEMRKVPHS